MFRNHKFTEMSKTSWAFLFILIFVPAASLADTVSCPEKIAHVTVDQGPPTIMIVGGHEKMFNNGVEQDIGGDYDEKASQAEWNVLHYDEHATPVIAHCFMHPNDKESIDIEIPESMKRCIATKDEFTCTSDEVACMGYVGNATIEGIRKGQFHRLLKPTLETKGGKKKVWDKFERGEDESLMANCYPEDAPAHGDYETLMLPPEVKSCRFENRRFICLLQPEK